MLPAKSQEKLKGVHPDLIKVINSASSGPVQFIVTEGVRDLRRQKQLVAEGKSRTLHSRHLVGTDGYAHAVDLAVLQKDGVSVTWDFPEYEKLAAQVKTAAKAAGVGIVWGGDWKSFRDGPHFELTASSYP
jgi:peptidoglycan L-alanyl-D-glutamate endopeptidase CwlK